MLPEKLHIEQISRFHSKMRAMKGKIDAEQDENKKRELCMQYFQLTELWNKIDDFIEFTLKNELDCMNP